VPATNIHRTRRIHVVLLVIGAVHSIHAQTAVRPELRFDAASVRPNHTAECRGRWDFTASHGTLTAENAPLTRIISRAFKLTDDRVLGPAWIESQCYDIVAKASGDVPERDLMPMLQTLLKERFHLVYHRESDEKAISVLVIDKGGAKLHPYAAKIDGPASTNGGNILFMARHMQDLCERIGKVTGRPVVDKTGLDGDYLIVLTYVPFGSTNNDSSDPGADIISAVRDQLGLRLESQRGLVEVLKIESVDKVPTEN
jgi:uncharacterized protein (TIGR03435 family)